MFYDRIGSRIIEVVHLVQWFYRPCQPQLQPVEHQRPRTHPAMAMVRNDMDSSCSMPTAALCSWRCPAAQHCLGTKLPCLSLPRQPNPPLQASSRHQTRVPGMRLQRLCLPPAPQKIPTHKRQINLKSSTDTTQKQSCMLYSPMLASCTREPPRLPRRAAPRGASEAPHAPCSQSFLAAPATRSCQGDLCMRLPLAARHLGPRVLPPGPPPSSGPPSQLGGRGGWRPCAQLPARLRRRQQVVAGREEARVAGAHQRGEVAQAGHDAGRAHQVRPEDEAALGGEGGHGGCGVGMAQD